MGQSAAVGGGYEPPPVHDPQLFGGPQHGGPPASASQMGRRFTDPASVPDGFSARQASTGRSRRFEDLCEFDRTGGPLGKGSFATVWKARLKQNNRAVAVKLMEKEQLRLMHVQAEGVISEVELMKECSSDLFVQLIDFIESSSRYYIVLEFCSHGNLQDAAMSGQAQLQEVQVRPLVRQIFQAIAFLHGRRICHRDVKPHNFLVSGSLHSDTAKVKLADFGIAVRFQPGKLMKEQVGTPAFMAPEMHLLPRRSPGYDAKVDVWAAGVVMVFLLAAEYPFVDGSGRLLRDQLVRGNMPLWEGGGVMGLFQAAQEAAGLRRKSPSILAKEIVRLTVNPRADRRWAAQQVLSHNWFTQPIQEGGMGPGSGNDEPLLRWEDFQEGLSFLEKHTQWVGDIVSGVSVGPTVAVDRPMTADSHDERMRSCVVCYGNTGALSYLCPQCRYVVCFQCLHKLKKPMCPHCRYEPSDMALSQAVMKAAEEASARVNGLKEHVTNAIKDRGNLAIPDVHVAMNMQAPAPVTVEAMAKRQKCFDCSAPSGATTYCCPACSSSVCHQCFLARDLGTKLQCPCCGEAECNGPAMKEYLSLAEAIHGVYDVGRSLSAGFVSVIGQDVVDDPAAAITNKVSAVTIEPLARHVEAASRKMSDMTEAAGAELSRNLEAAGSRLERFGSEWQVPAGGRLAGDGHLSRQVEHLAASATLGGVGMIASPADDRLHYCGLCKIKAVWNDHTCPQCGIPVCSSCICNRLAQDPRCPCCGDAASNAQAMRFVITAHQAKTQAADLVGSLWRLGSHLLDGGNNAQHTSGSQSEAFATNPTSMYAADGSKLPTPPRERAGTDSLQSTPQRLGFTHSGAPAASPCRVATPLAMRSWSQDTAPPTGPLGPQGTAAFSTLPREESPPDELDTPPRAVPQSVGKSDGLLMSPFAGRTASKPPPTPPEDPQPAPPPPGGLHRAAKVQAL
eukprot:TRINITY_DN188_c0_g1_i1.p1 TRINITY_DN188_c0_g1~~TRINITY_DN188_c0_g1_i1.p1  ORF type:complete len:958 (-),score=194.14 TRINITY_DN188_c0_g1_i1:254-3127(-)